MYESYYGLKEKPFSLKYKPEFLFQSENYREILGQLENAIRERNGFCVLSGLAGTGKTTLCESLRESLQNGFICKMAVQPSDGHTNPLHTILAAFGIDTIGHNEFELIGMGQAFLNRNYLKENLRAALIVDDAHHLSEEQLQQFASLMKLLSGERALLRVILAGKPPLMANLKRAGAPVTADRFTDQFELNPLTADETREFIVQRLRAVGSPRDNYFDKGACQAVFVYCRGIPRQINILCHIALEYGAIERTPRINEALIDEVAKDNGVDEFALLCDEEQANQLLWNTISLATDITATESVRPEPNASDQSGAAESASSTVLDKESSDKTPEKPAPPEDDSAADETTKWDFLQPYRPETVKEAQAGNNGDPSGEVRLPKETELSDSNFNKGKKLTFTFLDSYKENQEENRPLTQSDENQSEILALDEKLHALDQELDIKKERVEETKSSKPPPVAFPKKVASTTLENPIRKTRPVIAIAAGIAGLAITAVLFQLLPFQKTPITTPSDYAESPGGDSGDTSKNSKAVAAADAGNEDLVADGSQDRLLGDISKDFGRIGKNTDLAGKPTQHDERPATSDISVFERSNKQIDVAGRGAGRPSDLGKAEGDEADQTQSEVPLNTDPKTSVEQKAPLNQIRERISGVRPANNGLPLPSKSLARAAGEAAIVAPAKAGDNGQSQANPSSNEINQLLASAEELYGRRMMTTPVGKSALAAYQEVLLIEPNHPEALEGVRKIKQRYIDWAETAKNNGEYKNVAHYLDKALSLDPRDDKLLQSLQEARRDQARYGQMDAGNEAAGISAGGTGVATDTAKRVARSRPFAPPVSIRDVNQGILFDGKPSIVAINAKISGPIEKAEVLVSTPQGFKPYSMYDDATHGDKVGSDGIYHTMVRLKEPMRGTRFYIAAYTQTGGVVYSPPNAERETYRIRSEQVTEKAVDFTPITSRVGARKDLGTESNQESRQNP